MKKLKLFLLSSALSLLSLFFPVEIRAQFLGYISPQTVSQKVLNAVTAPTTAVIPNLGQSLHAITYTVATPCTNSMSLTLRLEATSDGSTWFPISEDAVDQNSGGFQGASQGGLTATGYYPAIRLNLAAFSCPSGQTPSITAFYAGTSTSNPSATGPFYQSTPYRKVILLNQPTTNAGTQAAVSVNVANGMTGGYLAIECSIATTGAQTNCPASMNVVVNAYVTFVGAPATTGSIRTGATTYTADSTSVISNVAFFNVPATLLYFTFSGAGTANVNWTVVYLGNSVATANLQTDPCAGTANTKRTAVQNITTATTTTLTQTPTPSQQSIYVCGLAVSMAATAATIDTIKLVGGTGTNCTTPGDLTGVFSTGTLSSGSIQISYGNGGATIATENGFQGGVSVCAVTTVGTTPTIGVTMTYVFQ